MFEQRNNYSSVQYRYEIATVLILLLTLLDVLYECISSWFVLELLEKDKTPNHDSVVIVQDDRMGFHICIVGY